jgi:hypothetical protein
MTFLLKDTRALVCRALTPSRAAARHEKAPKTGELPFFKNRSSGKTCEIVHVKRLNISARCGCRTLRL